MPFFSQIQKFTYLLDQFWIQIENYSVFSLKSNYTYTNSSKYSASASLFSLVPEQVLLLALEASLCEDVFFDPLASLEELLFPPPTPFSDNFLACSSVKNPTPFLWDMFWKASTTSLNSCWWILPESKVTAAYLIGLWMISFFSNSSQNIKEMMATHVLTFGLHSYFLFNLKWSLTKSITNWNWKYQMLIPSSWCFRRSIKRVYSYWQNASSTQQWPFRCLLHAVDGGQQQNHGFCGHFEEKLLLEGIIMGLNFEKKKELYYFSKTAKFFRRRLHTPKLRKRFLSRICASQFEGVSLSFFVQSLHEKNLWRILISF